jgi:hypothetical protein
MRGWLSPPQADDRHESLGSSNFNPKTMTIRLLAPITPRHLSENKEDGSFMGSFNAE